MKYREGLKGVRYKIVPNSWRRAVDVKQYVNKKTSQNPMVLDLLMGRTVFAYINPEERNSKGLSSLYQTAACNNKVLRLYQFDDIEDDVYKGFLMWMEDRATL